jgi:hypothetical protein
VEVIHYIQEQSRFDLYSRIDRARAIAFAKRKGFYSSLIRYYSRKINLWQELKIKGVTVKRVKKDIKVDLRLA